MFFERRWQLDVNRSQLPTSVALRSQYFMWYMKAFLKGEIGPAVTGTWTCVSSSNGVTTSTGDLWGATFDSAQIVRAAQGVAHSWIVLQSPAVPNVSGGAAPFYLNISFEGSNDYAFNVAYSKVKPSGNLTSRPTSADEWAPMQSSGNPSATPGQMIENVANVNVRNHGGLCEDGSFFFLQSRDGTQQFYTMFMYSTLTGTKAIDQYPICTVSIYGTTAAAKANNFTGYSSTTTNYCRNFNGTSIVLCPCLHPAVQNTGVAWTTITTTLVGIDMVDGTWWDFPFIISPSGSIRGRVQDFQLTNYTNTQLPVGTVDYPVTQMNIEGFWVPWSASLGAVTGGQPPPIL